MTFILGLTGGIATGKSTVSRYFAENGIPVVDADIIARKVVMPGSQGLADIVARFGEAVLLADGSLDRQRLGALIFSQEEERHKLNAVLQKYIRQQIKNETQDFINQGHALIVLDIPLLYEAGYERECDAVMVVYTTSDVQLARLMARNHLSEQEAHDRITSQMSLEEKKSRADIVIDNNGTLSETYQQVEKWLESKDI